VRALGILAVALSGAACRSNAEAPPSARVKLAIVQGLGGRVDVLRAGVVDWRSIGSGAELYDGDRVRTFKDAWARLIFEGGSALRVEEESLIALGGGVTVERGSVEGELAAGLRVKTPALEAETATSRDIQFR
jgi:hypothetical protein